MKKVFLIALKSSREQILSRLHKFGALHISELMEGDESTADMDRSGDEGKYEESRGKLEKIDAVISKLKRYDERKKPLLPIPNRASYDSIVKSLGSGHELMPLIAYSAELDSKKMELNSSAVRLEAAASRLHPWLALDLDVRNIADTASCRVMAGTMPAADSRQYIEELEAQDKLLIQKVYADRDYVYLFIIYHNADNEEMTQLLSRAGFMQASFPKSSGTPMQIYESLENQRREIQDQLRGIEEEESGFAEKLPELERLYDAMSVECDLLRKAASLGGTQHVFYLTGYIPAHMEDDLRKLIADAAGDACDLTISEPDNPEEVPTMMENNALVDPFESITSMFGTPQSTSIDHNMVMSIFYSSFFGMMLSDAGYGIILAVACTILYILTLPKGRKKGGNKLLGVLAISGVLTIFWGALFGGWLGLPVKPLWFNPMEEPLLMLGLCFALGMLHLVTGLVLKGIIAVKHKQYMDAFVQSLSWIILLVGLSLFAMPALVAIAGSTASPLLLSIGQIGKYMTIAGVVIILLFGGYGRKGIGRFTGGLSSLYGISGYLSDVLSYSRLFALGLTTSVISMAVNVIVDLIWGSFFGTLAAMLIFVGGNVFNLVINVLGAYVHSSRLQYIEFFGKFFEGGGTPYEPFVPKTKYYKIND